jgi:hypothetical protein
LTIPSARHFTAATDGNASRLGGIFFVRAYKYFCNKPLRIYKRICRLLSTLHDTQRSEGVAMSKTEHDRGYDACLDGEPLDLNRSDAWIDGWNAANELRQSWLDLCDTADFFA